MQSAAYQIGYCTNVHPGRSLDEVQLQLDRHAVGVQQRLNWDGALGVGLWLSANAARQLSLSGQVAEFRRWLAERRLLPFTFNGFPYGDFHQARVKHRVYQPTWAERRRAEFTLQLIDLLHALLPEDRAGSISTLPLGWRETWHSDEFFRASAEALHQVAQHLQRLEERTGRLIRVGLEPEPGCWLQRSGDVVEFFQRWLLGHGEPGDRRALRYLGVCHDVCHAAVMRECQQAAIDRYHSAGIAIVKVQVSSAVDVDFDALDSDAKTRALEHLELLAEDRYLHQTTVQRRRASLAEYPDLPQALEQNVSKGQPPGGAWRVHFHVPVLLPQIGALGTTQSDISIAFERLLRRESTVAGAVEHHLEVETYAWTVLPEPLKTADLAEGIARELQWTRREVDARRGRPQV